MQMAENEKIDRRNKITIEKNKIANSNYGNLKNIYKQQIDAQNFRTNEYVLRTFTINHFGIWNCDQPTILQNIIPTSLNF